MYHSIIIEESLRNPEILRSFKILKTKFVAGEKPDEVPWHMHIVEIPEPIEKNIKRIQEAMVAEKPYYFHIYNEGKTLIVVFKDKVFYLDPNNQSTWQKTRRYGAAKLNIPAEQLDFSPRKISEEDKWYNE